MATYTVTVSVPVLVTVRVEAKTIADAESIAIHKPNTSDIVNAAEWGRFGNDVQIAAIERD